jgi:hypothetical protein
MTVVTLRSFFADLLSQRFDIVHYNKDGNIQFDRLIAGRTALMAYPAHVVITTKTAKNVQKT